MEELQKCEICGSEEAEYVIDPYVQEIDGIETWRWLCVDCYNEACGDV